MEIHFALNAKCRAANIHGLPVAFLIKKKKSFAVAVKEAPECNVFLLFQLKQQSEQMQIQFISWKIKFPEGERTWDVKDNHLLLIAVNFASHSLFLKVN